MRDVKFSYDRTTEWAFGLFRPVLKDLQLQSLTSKSYVRTSQKKYGFDKLNMNHCVIIAMQYKFTNPNDKGVFVWTYDRARAFYILYIIVNENMYSDEMSHEDCVKRKLVTTHEFTHCTAAMLSLSQMKSNQLIESLQKNMRKNVDVIQSVDVDGVMNELSKKMANGLQAEKLELSFRKFDDEHFRTKYENFEGSYYDLNTNLLFSKQLFEEYFDESERKEFNEYIKEGKFPNAVTILTNAAGQVIKEKNLPTDLVLNRLITDFMPVYLHNAIEL